MAYPFRAILSPVDFDENSLAALNTVKQLAMDYNAAVHVLHVPRIVVIPVEGALVVDSLEEQEENARRALKEIVDTQLGGVSHQLAIRIGDPAECILQAAKELNADLIVMATHGRSGAPHFFLGSVAEKVVRESTCPVLTIRRSV